MLAVILKEFRIHSRSKNLYLIQAFSLIFLSSSTIFLSSLHNPSQDTHVLHVLNVSSFSIFCFLIAIIVYAIAPILAVDGIALEREEDTFQLLASTSTSYLGILFGKLCHISIFIGALLWLSLPMGGLLALLSGTKSSEILDCYLVILISAITFVYISLAVSLLFSRVQVAIGLSYLILAFFCIGTLAGASLFNVFLLRLFSPFFAILNVTGNLGNLYGYGVNVQPFVPFVPFVRLPNFLVVSAIYAPIWGIISAFVSWKGR